MVGKNVVEMARRSSGSSCAGFTTRRDKKNKCFEAE